MLAGCGTVPRSHRSCAAVALRSRRAAMPTQNWREVYELALIELDASKLPRRVEAALRAIQQRSLQKKETLSRKECEETDDALRALCRGHATARGVSKQRVAFGGYASDDHRILAVAASSSSALLLSFVFLFSLHLDFYSAAPLSSACALGTSRESGFAARVLPCSLWKRLWSVQKV